MNLILEIVAVVFGLLYLVFLIRENKICWYFGIIGSLISVFLFYKTQLYSEAILYIYYVFIGVYGFLLWNKSIEKNKELRIRSLSKKKCIYIIIIGVVLALLLGYIFETYTDASAPFLDAFTTSFSFIASYLEAKKYLSSWVFWIVINGLTIGLYWGKELHIYMGLTVIYLIFSFVGYVEWNKKRKVGTLLS